MDIERRKKNKTFFCFEKTRKIKNFNRQKKVSEKKKKREEKRKKTSLGKKIASYIDKGNLVPAELIAEIIENKLNGSKYDSKRNNMNNEIINKNKKIFPSL